MQDYQSQSQSQFTTPQAPLNTAVPDHIVPAPQAAAQQYTQDVRPVASQDDPLTQATQAVEACIARTTANPNIRMQEIARIRAAYIKAKFGMDITQ